jgi:hypothetical protein
MQKKTLSPGGAIRILTAFSVVAFALTARATAISGFETVNNTDWVMAGTGNMRDSGVGTITVNSLYGGGIDKAYLYWAGPTDSASQLNGQINFTTPGNPGGSTITGSFLGFSSDNNAGFLNSQAFRADVTAEIGSLSVGANAFTLSGFPSNPIFGDYYVNGASLLILYKDGTTANDRNLAIFGGNDSDFQNNPYDNWGWQANLNGVNYGGSGAAYLHVGVSDGQLGPSLDPTAYLNGSPLLPTTWTGINPGGDPNTGRWDFATWDITSSLVAGPNNLEITNGLTGFLGEGVEDPFTDFTALIHGFIDMPATAETPVPEPTTVISGLAFATLAAARLLRRRR